MSIVQTEADISVPGLSSDGAIAEFIEDSSPMNYLEAVETVISSLAQEDTAMVNHGETGHLWKFKYGSVEVYVQLSGTTDDDTFTVWSQILKLPVQKEDALLRKLMEMNWGQTFEARYAISENSIVVVSKRMMADLSPAEISQTITIVAMIADENDELLQAEFPSA